jgi:hypothetical protein
VTAAADDDHIGAVHLRLRRQHFSRFFVAHKGGHGACDEACGEATPLIRLPQHVLLDLRKQLVL